MNNSISFSSTDNHAIDPRNAPDFCPDLMPAVSGQPLPLTGYNPVLLQFAAAYYELNRQYARLLECRAGGRQFQQPAEREILQAIEMALQRRDQLEDLHAPSGFIVQPILREGFTVDLQWSSGQIDRRGQLRSELVTIRGTVPIPLPAGASVDDFLTAVEMPEGFA